MIKQTSQFLVYSAIFTYLPCLRTQTMMIYMYTFFYDFFFKWYIINLHADCAYIFFFCLSVAFIYFISYFSYFFKLHKFLQVSSQTWLFTNYCITRAYKHSTSAHCQWNYSRVWCYMHVMHICHLSTLRVKWSV